MSYPRWYNSFYNSDHWIPCPSEEIVWFCFFLQMRTMSLSISFVFVSGSSETMSKINCSKCAIPYRIHFFILFSMMSWPALLIYLCPELFFFSFHFSFIFYHVTMFRLQITSNYFLLEWVRVYINKWINKYTEADSVFFIPEHPITNPSITVGHHYRNISISL